MPIKKDVTKLLKLFNKDSTAMVVRGSSFEKKDAVGEILSDKSHPEKMDQIQICDEYKDALDTLDQHCQVLFVTGKAGTGKSTFIRFLRSRLGGDIPVLAPTGVAALNVGGQTIHSFFQLPPRVVEPHEIKVLKNRKLFKALRILIIDEISMVRADLMDAVDISLRKNTGKEELAFGGVQLILVGDLLQLPPVIASEPEMQYLKSRYRTPYFLSADCIQNSTPRVVELTKVYRQQDEKFIHLLSKIRMGEEVEYAVSQINASCYSTGDYPDDQSITLTAVNYTAEKINSRKLAQLPGEMREYVGIVSGQFTEAENALPAPKVLKLRVGSHVMCTRNDQNHRWVNGTLGMVVAFSDSTISIQTATGVFKVNREIWETIQYRYDQQTGKIKAEIIGTYTQFPLMLSWAITIHKSQGKTLDRVVIDLGNGAFAEGQVYVALSRCRSLDGIRLKKPIRESDIRVDPVVKNFYVSLKRV